MVSPHSPCPNRNIKEILSCIKVYFTLPKRKREEVEEWSQLGEMGGKEVRPVGPHKCPQCEDFYLFYPHRMTCKSLCCFFFFTIHRLPTDYFLWSIAPYSENLPSGTKQAQKTAWCVIKHFFANISSIYTYHFFSFLHLHPLPYIPLSCTEANEDEIIRMCVCCTKVLLHGHSFHLIFYRKHSVFTYTSIGRYDIYRICHPIVHLVFL